MKNRLLLIWLMIAGYASSIEAQDSHYVHQSDINYFNQLLSNSQFIYELPKDVRDLHPLTRSMFSNEIIEIFDGNEQIDKFRWNIPFGSIKNGKLYYSGNQIIGPYCIDAIDYRGFEHMAGFEFIDYGSFSKSLEIILTDVLISSKIKEEPFLLYLLYKLSYVNEVALGECYIEINCALDFREPFLVFWNNGFNLTYENNSEFITRSVPNEFITKEFLFNDEIDLNKNSDKFVLNSINLILKDILMSKFKKDKVSDLTNKEPAQYLIKNINNVVTKDDGYWENLEISIYGIRLLSDRILISGHFDGDYFKTISPYPPSNEAWEDKGKRIVYNNVYRNNLKSLANELLQNIFDELEFK